MYTISAMYEELKRLQAISPESLSDNDEIRILDLQKELGLDSVKPLATDSQEPIDAPEHVACGVVEDILDMDIQPTRWVIQDLLPEGVAILSAPPKEGKTRLAYQIAAAAATGGSFYGYQAQAQKVLYIDYETFNYDIQHRLKRLINDPSSLDRRWSVMSTWPTVKDGGIEQLDKALADHVYNLVIIDTWAYFSPESTSRGSTYSLEKKAITPLSELVKKYHCCILLITHSKPRGAKHGVSAVGGSYGLTGTADTIMTLNDAILSVTGRSVNQTRLDLSDSPLADKPPTKVVQFSDYATKRVNGDKRQIFLDLLTDRALTAKELTEMAKMPEKTRASNQKFLQRMEVDGLLVHSDGKFTRVKSSI